MLCYIRYDPLIIFGASESLGLGKISLLEFEYNNLEMWKVFSLRNVIEFLDNLGQVCFLQTRKDFCVLLSVLLQRERLLIFVIIHSSIKNQFLLLKGQLTITWFSFVWLVVGQMSLRWRNGAMWFALRGQTWLSLRSSRCIQFGSRGKVVITHSIIWGRSHESFVLEYSPFLYFRCYI